MLLHSIIGGSTFLAIVLFATWALQGVGGTAEARVRALSRGRLPGAGQADSLPFQARVVAPLIESTGRRVAAMLPAAFLRRAERRLIIAGQPMRPATFYTLMFTFGALFAGLYILLIVVGSNGRPPFIAMLPAIILAGVGMYVISFWLSSTAKSRRKEMAKGLPDSMDLLTICVEAGLGLDAAFHRVAEKQSGPLVDEIRQMLREIGLGKSRRDAMLDLADRTDLEEVRTFANAVIQAEKLGTSLAQVLRVQSDRLRIIRRQQTEQEARRAPVKMVFPLVFCLMPSLFIFILGPIVVNLIGFLSN